MSFFILYLREGKRKTKNKRNKASKQEKEEAEKKERKGMKLLAKQGSFKGGQSSNYLDKAGGTSLRKLIKLAFNLGSQLPLEINFHIPCLACS